jgi:hypothetical protein
MFDSTGRSNDFEVPLEILQNVNILVLKNCAIPDKPYQLNSAIVKIENTFDPISFHKLRFTKVPRLFLYGCEIRCFSELSNYSTLKLLSVSECGIYSIAKLNCNHIENIHLDEYAFSHVYNLSHLKVGSFEQLPEGQNISQLANAIKLKISYSYISSIPLLLKTVHLHQHDRDITAFEVPTSQFEENCESSNARN